MPCFFKMNGEEALKYKCLCCGYYTLEVRAEFEICPVCFWEDDAYLILDPPSEPIVSLYFLRGDIPPEDLLDIPSGANHGLSLRQGRANYEEFGACDIEMKPYVRPPNDSER